MPTWRTWRLVPRPMPIWRTWRHWIQIQRHLRGTGGHPPGMALSGAWTGEGDFVYRDFRIQIQRHLRGSHPEVAVSEAWTVAGKGDFEYGPLKGASVNRVERVMLLTCESDSMPN